MESSKTNFSAGVYFKMMLRDEALDAHAMFGEQLEAAFLLVRVAQDADEHDGGFQIACDIHVVDGDQARVADVKFAADGLADFALEQFAHTLESEAGHVFR